MDCWTEEPEVYHGLLGWMHNSVTELTFFKNSMAHYVTQNKGTTLGNNSNLTKTNVHCTHENPGKLNDECW